MEDEVGQIVIGKENLDGERKPTKTISLHGEEFRRSVYVQVRRSRPLATLETFDTPAMVPNCDRRASSNVAPQSLWFMNSQFVLSSSSNFARRLREEVPHDLKGQVTQAWQIAFGTKPAETDVSQAVEFITRQQQVFRSASPPLSEEEAAQKSLASFCQALISSNRFLYVE